MIFRSSRVLEYMRCCLATFWGQVEFSLAFQGLQKERKLTRLLIQL